ncbi:Uncharacterised protein [Mycobacterium tuberculosis]|nr:Uncharacterised protein [Mycobacterium tuberculosis]
MRWLQKHHLQKQNLSLTRKQKQSPKQLTKGMSLSQQPKLIRLKKKSSQMSLKIQKKH